MSEQKVELPTGSQILEMIYTWGDQGALGYDELANNFADMIRQHVTAALAARPASPALPTRQELAQSLYNRTLGRVSKHESMLLDWAESLLAKRPPSPPAVVTRHQWDLWLGTDHTLESLNAIMAEPEPLTPERVHAALKRGAAGANELLKQTKMVFRAPDRDLRLGASRSAVPGVPSSGYDSIAHEATAKAAIAREQLLEMAETANGFRGELDEAREQLAKRTEQVEALLKLSAERYEATCKYAQEAHEAREQLAEERVAHEKLRATSVSFEQEMLGLAKSDHDRAVRAEAQLQALRVACEAQDDISEPDQLERDGYCETARYIRGIDAALAGFASAPEQDDVGDYFADLKRRVREQIAQRLSESRALTAAPAPAEVAKPDDVEPDIWERKANPNDPSCAALLKCWQAMTPEERERIAAEARAAGEKAMWPAPEPTDPQPHASQRELAERVERLEMAMRAVAREFAVANWSYVSNGRIVAALDGKGGGT